MGRSGKGPCVRSEGVGPGVPCGRVLECVHAEPVGVVSVRVCMYTDVCESPSVRVSPLSVCPRACQHVYRHTCMCFHTFVSVCGVYKCVLTKTGVAYVRV